MKFNKVAISEVKAQLTGNYADLKGAVEALPFYEGNENDPVLTITCDSEKEERNTRNALRAFAKRNKIFGLEMQKCEGDTDFCFRVKKIHATPSPAPKA